MARGGARTKVAPLALSIKAESYHSQNVVDEFSQVSRKALQPQTPVRCTRLKLSPYSST